jgi:DNA-binding transcriptional regulator YiaG
MSAAHEWTGRDATALRKAFRMTEGRFAAALQVSSRTVANWVTNPGTIPRAAVQDMLDRLFERKPGDQGPVRGTHR